MALDPYYKKKGWIELPIESLPPAGINKITVYMSDTGAVNGISQTLCDIKRRDSKRGKIWVARCQA